MKIKFHHKGYFISDPVVDYKKGEIYEFGGEWDIDEVNLLDLDKLVREIGVKGSYQLWYVSPGAELKDGLRALKTDRDIINFINEFKGESVTDFYVEGEEILDARYDTDVEEVEEVVEEQSEYETDPEYVAEGELGAEEGAESVEGDDSVDGSLNDSEYDEGWEWTNVLPEQTVKPTAIVPSEVSADNRLVAVESSRNPAETTLSDFEDENGDSSDLDSPNSDESDRGNTRSMKFKYSEGDVVKYQLGQTFANADLIKTSVKEYALQIRKNIYLKKSEKKRIIVKCLKTCPFHMRFCRTDSKIYFVLSSLNSAHKCHKNSKIRLFKTKLLAQKFVPILKHTPNSTLKSLGTICKNQWGVILTKFKIYRAKVKALEMIQGAIEKQYAHLRNYAEELLRSNPNSTISIKCKPGADGPVFQRMYVCFYACKKAFVQSCRPLIGLDGCFLKGRYGGQLLTAVGKDGNNQMMPIAFAIVEAETKDSWDWFLDLLLSDLNRIEYKRWSFISDQQKVCVFVAC